MPKIGDQNEVSHINVHGFISQPDALFQPTPLQNLRPVPAASERNPDPGIQNIVIFSASVPAFSIKDRSRLMKSHTHLRNPAFIAIARILVSQLLCEANVAALQYNRPL